MKKMLALTVSILAASFILTNSASANSVFASHCAACHAGGKNIMNPDKDLSMANMEKNGVNTVDAIKALVTNGKAPMPAFKSQLDAAQIDSVANYVLEQAKKGW